MSTQAVTLGSDGGTWTLNLTNTGAAWTAVANTSFLHITGAASGVDDATILFSADANTGSSSRTGTLTVAGLAVTVTQLSKFANVPRLATLASVSSGVAPVVAVDHSGNVYFGDTSNEIKKWDAVTPCD